jgi:hypothetical protein
MRRAAVLRFIQTQAITELISITTQQTSRPTATRRLIVGFRKYGHTAAILIKEK